MAQVTVQRYAAELGRLPPVCMCCGQQASLLVRHKFYYDPLWLIALGPVMGMFRYLWASQSLFVAAPVCSRHSWRLSLPTYIGYGFAVSLLILAPLLIAAGQVQSLRESIGWIWLAVFLYTLGMLALMLMVRLATPRMVDFDTGSVTFGSVALAFKAAITGQAMPGQGMLTPGLHGPPAIGGMPAGYSPAGHSPAGYSRAPSTSNGPLIALVGIGGGVLVLVFLGCLVLGAVYFNRARRDAEFRRLQADAQQFHDKARADAEANHQRIMAEQQANRRRTATSAPTFSAPPFSSPSPAPPKTTPTSTPTTSTPPTSTPPTSTPPTSTPTTSTPPTSTLPTNDPFSRPIPSTPPPTPPQANSDKPADSVTDPDPFGIGSQIGPPSNFSAGGIPPKPREDLSAKADIPIRGRFNEPDAKVGPDGQVEVMYRPQRNDPPYPPTSKPLTRVNDLKVGAEIWVQDHFRAWYRASVLGIDGLRAMVHVHGRDSITDELTPIPRIRLAADTEQPAAEQPAAQQPFAERPIAEKPFGDDAKNPFEDLLPPRKRTWTDTTGKFKIQAEFIKLAAGKVTLKREDGSEISLPLEMLAAGDQQIARQLGGM